MSKAPRSASSPAKKPSGKSNAFLFTPDDFAASLSEPVDVSQFEENSDVLGLNPEKNIDEALKMLGNDADDVHVEVSEADLEDPQLLSELAALDESPSKPAPPTTGQDESEPEEEEEVVVVKGEGAGDVTEDDNDEEAHGGEDVPKVARQPARSGSTQTGEVRAQAPVRAAGETAAAAAPIGSAVKRKAAEDEPAPAALEDDAGEAGGAVDAALVRELEGRLREYSVAAVQARRAGRREEALRLVADVKRLRAALAAARAGRPTGQIPPPLRPPASAAPAAAESVEQVQARMREEYARLERTLEEQVRAAHRTALQAKESGDRSGAVRAYHLQKELQRDLAELRARRDAGHPPPRGRTESVALQEAVTVAELREDELELRLEAADFAKGGLPGGYAAVDAYAYLELQLPEAPRPLKIRTPTVRAGPDAPATWGYAVRLRIDRKRSMVRFVQRRRLQVRVYHSRFLLPHVLLGEAELPLAPLCQQCRVQGAFPLALDRKLTGASLRARLTLRTPLLQPEMRLIARLQRTRLDWSAASVPLPLPPIAPSASTASATPRSPVVAVPPSSPPPVPSAAATTTAPADAQRSPTAPVSPSRTPASAAPASTPAPAPAAAAAAAAKAPAASAGETEGALENWDSVDLIVSNEVLEAELEAARRALPSARGEEREALEDRVQQLELKMQLLVLQVQTGQLSMPAYLDLLRARIRADRALAQALAKASRHEPAKKVLRRVKIMEKELTEAEQQAEEES